MTWDIPALTATPQVSSSLLGQVPVLGVVWLTISERESCDSPFPVSPWPCRNALPPGPTALLSTAP